MDGYVIAIKAEGRADALAWAEGVGGVDVVSALIRELRSGELAVALDEGLEVADLSLTVTRIPMREGSNE